MLLWTKLDGQTDGRYNQGCPLSWGIRYKLSREGQLTSLLRRCKVLPTENCVMLVRKIESFFSSLRMNYELRYSPSSQSVVTNTILEQNSEWNFRKNHQKMKPNTNVTSDAKVRKFTEVGKSLMEQNVDSATKNGSFSHNQHASDVVFRDFLQYI